MFDGEDHDELLAACTEGMTESEKKEFLQKMSKMHTALLEEQVDLQEQNIAFLDVDSAAILGTVSNSGMKGVKTKHRRTSVQEPFAKLGPLPASDPILEDDGDGDLVQRLQQANDANYRLQTEVQAYQDAQFEYSQLIEKYKTRIRHLEEANNSLTEKLETSRKDQERAIESYQQKLEEQGEEFDSNLQIQQLEMALNNALEDLSYERDKCRQFEAQLVKDLCIKSLNIEPPKSVLKGLNSVPRGLSVTFDPVIVWMSSALSGDINLINQFLQDGFDVNTRNPDNLTALHNACCDNDNVDLVLLLISSGADVNCIDSDGWSPLHGSACCGHYDICKVLLENGASMNIPNNDNETPYELCVENSEQQQEAMTLFTDYHNTFHSHNYVYCTFEYVAERDDELDVNVGEGLTVLLDQKEGENWWKVENILGERGMIPSIHCTLYPLYKYNTESAQITTDDDVERVIDSENEEYLISEDTSDPDHIDEDHKDNDQAPIDHVISGDDVVEVPDEPSSEHAVEGPDVSYGDDAVEVLVEPALE